MTTQINGHSDDVIELHGDIYDELYPCYRERTGYICLSDGTALRYMYDSDGIWRLIPVVKGSLFERVDQGSAVEDTNDVAHFKDGLKWACLTRGDNNLVASIR